MKPGSVIKVTPQQKDQEEACLLLSDSLNCFSLGEEPQKKSIPKGEIGFVVTLPKSNELAFDWLVEVSFPDFSVQGWIQKTDIILVIP